MPDGTPFALAAANQRRMLMNRKLTKFVILFALAACMLPAHFIFAAAGDLDPTFGNGGITIFDTQDQSADFGFYSRVRPDGKIVISGAIFGGSENFGVARLMPDGTPDLTFGIDGKVVTVVGAAMALQPDGKIVLAGWGNCVNFNCDVAVMRLNTDGSPDAAFGTNGIVFTHVQTDAFALTVLIQPDGKIVAGGAAGFVDRTSSPAQKPQRPGYTTNAQIPMRNELGPKQLSNRFRSKKPLSPNLPGDEFYDFALVRYNSDGSIDTTFGNAGVVLTKMTQTSVIRAIILQPDQKLVAVGLDSINVEAADVAIARYNSSGELDGSFNNTGLIIANIEGRDDFGNDVVLLPDGKIAVAASSVVPFAGDSKLAVYQFLANGTPDLSFATNGRFLSDSSAGNQAGSGIQHDSSGRLYVTSDTTNDFTLFAFLPNGQPDPSFHGGSVNIDLSTDNEGAFKIALQSDGRILLTGTSGDNSVKQDMTVLQLLSNGSLDPSFSTDGVVTIPFTTSFDEDMRKVKVLSDGKILAAGNQVSLSTVSAPLFTRFNSDGSVDTSFGSNGYTVVELPDYIDVTDMDVAGDGKIVASMRIPFTETKALGLVRLLESGASDSTFGAGGAVTIPIQNGIFGARLAIQPDNKIVVAADVAPANSDDEFDIALLRFNADGSLDPGFGTGGIVIINPSFTQRVGDVLLQPDGKIIVIGFTQSDSNEEDYLVARFNTDGTPDSSFGSNGLVTIDFSGDTDEATAGFLQPDGSLLIGGSVLVFEDLGIAKLLPDGTPDPSFGNAGLVTLDIEHGEFLVDLAALADGRIIVAGRGDAGTTLAALQPNGAIDPTFGTAGKVIYDFASNVTAVVDATERIVVGAAENERATFDNFAVARFATAPPNSSVLFFDDFEDSVLNWTVTRSGWQETGGTLIGNNGSAMAPTPWQPSGNSSCSTCTLRMTVNLSSEHGTQGKLTLIGWRQSKEKQTELTLKPKTGKITLVQHADGHKAKITARFPLNFLQTYTVEISFDGTNFHASIDSVEILNVPAVGSPAGNIGLSIKKLTAAIGDALVF